MSQRTPQFHHSSKEPDIYSNKSSLILEWLILSTREDVPFSIRDLAQLLNLSVGLVHKVIKLLVFYGAIEEEGKNTAKKFTLRNRQGILSAWINHYNIQKKCKIWSYNFGSIRKEEVMKRIKRPKYRGQVAFALHSAADALGYKASNLDTLELYVLNEDIRKELEKEIKPSPKKNSLGFILIEPYYRSILLRAKEIEGVLCSPPLLTFLDLYHFPLRGIEQAESIANNYSPLKKAYNKNLEGIW